MNEPRLHLLLPLASSLLYVLGAVLLKRATAAAGVGLWRAAFVTNLVSAVAFLPLLALGGPGQSWTAIRQPAVVALLLVAGQCASLWALTRGDVSVATPVLGVKIILVAFIPLFGEPLRKVPRTIGWVLLGGAVLVALQGLLLITTIAVFGDATSVNIVYGTRGLWSVLLVWLAGRWLGSEEFDRGAGVLGGRLAGALLMTAAVVVVFR